jgi:hypothetical protein
MVIYGLRRPSFVPFIAYKGPAGDLETATILAVSRYNGTEDIKPAV